MAHHTSLITRHYLAFFFRLTPRASDRSLQPEKRGGLVHPVGDLQTDQGQPVERQLEFTTPLPHCKLLP
jgi:hypothetical protein